MKHAALIVPALALALLCGPAGARHRNPPQSSGFDYYVMSLSWSPTFCESHRDNPQCVAHPGLVLHGLWPQFARGGYPQHCATPQRLDDDARALGGTVFPTEALMVHEWQTHGTCSGMSALDYFKAAQAAHASIAVPSALNPGSNTWRTDARAIASALRDANPALTARGLALSCGHHELAEVRVCLGKDLKPMACGRDVTDSCSGSVSVPGAR